MSWLRRLFGRTDPVMFADDNVLKLRATTLVPPEPRKAQVLEFRKNTRAYMAVRRRAKSTL